MKSKIIISLMLLMVLSTTVASAGLIEDITGALNIQTGSIYGSQLTINSITADKPITNNADLQTANFLISATVNNGGQTIAGNFDGSDFKQLSGVQTTYPLTISLGNVKEVLSYPIVNQGSIYKWVATWSNEMDRNAVITYCQQSTADFCYRTLVRTEWFGTANYYKALEVRSSAIGSNGILNNPSLTWSGDMTVSVNGLSSTQSIGSGQTDPNQITSPSLTFYSGSTFIATAAWQGNLLTGQATPYPGLYRAIYNKGTGTWKVASTQYWDAYSQSYTSSRTTQSGWKTTGNIDCANNAAWDANCADVMNIINPHNSKVDVLLAQNTAVTYTSGTGESLSSSTKGGESNGYVVETTNRRIANPVFTMRVAAKNLGVIIPVQKPSIELISAPAFSSGGTGTAVVTVRNNGDTSASFVATFTESSGTFYPEGTSGNVIIGPHQTGVLTVGIGHGNNAADITKTAIMRVYDANMASNYVEQPFTISMTVPRACTPGVQRVVGTNVYTCNADGMGEVLTISCPIGILTYDAATLKYSCKDAGNGETQILYVAVYNPDKVTLADAPIWIDGIKQSERGYLSKNLALGPHSIKTDNSSNQTWFAPLETPVTLTKDKPESVILYFETTPPSDLSKYLWVVWVVLGCIALFIVARTGNPYLIGTAIVIIGGIIMFYMVSEFAKSLSTTIMNSPIGAAYNLINYITHLGGLI